MEILSIDFFHLVRCPVDYEYLLVIMHHFIRYTQTYPTRNNASRTAAERIFNDFILRLGIPKHFLYDEGKEFDNKLFHQLTKLCGVSQATKNYPHTIPNLMGQLNA